MRRTFLRFQRRRLSGVQNGRVKRRIVRVVEVHGVDEATVDQRTLFIGEYFREENVEFNDQIASPRGVLRVG